MNLNWNPWHGCRRYSEGCQNCYMFYLDAKRGRDGGEIYRVKGNFDLPVRKNRQGGYKIPDGTTLYVCMTSDFFLEEADEWRPEAWDMIRRRPGVHFWLLTKRAERMAACLPPDWGDGWENVTLNVTCENQRCADLRLPLLLALPARHKGLLAAPLIGPLDPGPYLATGQIESVSADGENYEGARPLDYDWVRLLYDRCRQYGVPFRFSGTGNRFRKDGKLYEIPRAYHRVEALRSGLQLPPLTEPVSLQKRCAACPRRNDCRGCRSCGRCEGRK